MNIFVLSTDPVKAAQQQCDKHVPKMVVESAQMLCSAKRKLDGTPYKTDKGAFRNHPCTVWAQDNWTWLIVHGLALCFEYTLRYGKIHSCQSTIEHAEKIFPPQDTDPTHFVFAGPDQFKHDKTIDIFTAYKYYINSKPWVSDNYLRLPDRKPNWVN